MTIELSPPWEDLEFLSPLSGERAGRLVAFLADVDGLIVEVGCGWSELLLRVVAAARRSTALGIDLDADAIAEARRRAADRQLSERVTLTTENADTSLPDDAAAALCVGSTHAWAPPAEGADEPLHYDRALQRIRALLPVGGKVVYGEGIWSRPPTPQATQYLGGRDDEMVPLEELVAIAEAAGFTANAVHEATTEEWDEFESGFTAAYSRWLTMHDESDPDAEEVRRRLARQRAAYHEGYRSILGFAYLELVATS